MIEDILDEKEAKIVVAALNQYLRHIHDLKRTRLFRTNMPTLEFNQRTAETLQERISEKWRIKPWVIGKDTVTP